MIQPYLDAPVANVQGNPSVAEVAGVDPAQDVIDLVSSTLPESGTATPTGGAAEAVFTPVEVERIASAVPVGEQLAALENALAVIRQHRYWHSTVDRSSVSPGLVDRVQDELGVLDRLTPWGLHLLFDPLDEREVALHDSLASALENAFNFANDARLRSNLHSDSLTQLLGGLGILTASARSHFDDARRRAVLRNSAARFRIQENQSGPDVVTPQAMVAQLLDDSEEYEGGVPESWRFYLEEDVSDDDDDME